VVSSSVHYGKVRLRTEACSVAMGMFVLCNAMRERWQKRARGKREFGTGQTCRAYSAETSRSFSERRVLEVVGDTISILRPLSHIITAATLDGETRPYSEPGHTRKHII